jgi:hypothetical protein
MYNEQLIATLEKGYLIDTFENITVGLFWYFNNELQVEYKEYASKSSRILYVGASEVFINPEKDHISIWYATYNQVAKTVRDEIIKKYGNVDYTYYPRGRVIYYVNKKTKQRNYLVLLDKCYLNDKNVHNQIIDAFGLSGKVKFTTDGHYKCNECKHL